MSECLLRFTQRDIVRMFAKVYTAAYCQSLHGGILSEVTAKVHMAAKVNFPLEGATTLGTRERFVPSVLAAVCDKIG